MPAFLIVALLVLAGLMTFLVVPAYLGRRRLEFRSQILTLLATAAKRSVPFAPLLLRASEEHQGRRAEALATVATKLRDGELLSQALTAVAPWFPERVFAAIKSSEGTDQLAALLKSLANDTTIAMAARHRLAMTMFYPTCLGVFLLGLQSVYADFTQVARTVGNSTPSWSLLITIALTMLWLAAAVGMLYRLAGWQPATIRRFVDTLVSNVPLLDHLIRLSAGERLLRSTAALVGAGLPLPQALRKAAPATGNARTGEAACASAALMEQGASADQAWSRTLLPPFAALRAATATGSSAGGLALSLDALATECGHRFAASVDRVLRWVQPATIALFGLLLAMQFANVFGLIYQFRSEVALW